MRLEPAHYIPKQDEFTALPIKITNKISFDDLN